MKKQFAVCIYGQSRAIKTSVKNMYENLINVLDADVYILVQKTNTETDNDIDLFDKKVVSKIIYDSPKDIENMFVNYNKLLKHDNYICNSSLQIYYNLVKINEEFGDIFEKNYRYIVMTRSDFNNLFPFPNILHFDNTDETFWFYNGNGYGGLNITLVCVPSKFIKQYLTIYKSFLDDSNNIELINSVPLSQSEELPSVCRIRLNTEIYAQMLFDINKWSIGKIRSNAYISASSLQETTTGPPILYDSNRKLYYKYIKQYNDAFLGLEEYKSKKWTYDNSDNKKKIILA